MLDIKFVRENPDVVKEIFVKNSRIRKSRWLMKSSLWIRKTEILSRK